MFSETVLARKNQENFMTPAYSGLLFSRSLSKQVLSACCIHQVLGQVLGSYSSPPLPSGTGKSLMFPRLDEGAASTTRWGFADPIPFHPHARL